MNIFDENTDFNFAKSAVTLGKFDGFHLGHQRLIHQTVEKAKERGLESVIFSFDTAGITKQKSITTREERNMIAGRLGVDDLVYYPVNEWTMGMSPRDFVEKILVEKMNVQYIVTGEDFRFGKNREGDVQTLKELAGEYGYELCVMESVELDGEKVSSTAIKNYIRSGNVENAEKMLGFPFFYCGQVVRGNQIGRTIDSKTANLIPAEQKIVPEYGVYKTNMIVDGKKYKSITNIGLCPTVKQDRDEITIETNIFDFDSEIYQKDVIVELVGFIRKEKKFDNIDDLKSQILLDIAQAKF